jgi:hypothetical protein
VILVAFGHKFASAIMIRDSSLGKKLAKDLYFSCLII